MEWQTQAKQKIYYASYHDSYYYNFNRCYEHATTRYRVSAEVPSYLRRNWNQLPSEAWENLNTEPDTELAYNSATTKC